MSGSMRIAAFLLAIIVLVGGFALSHESNVWLPLPLFALAGGLIAYAVKGRPSFTRKRTAGPGYPDKLHAEP